MSHRAAVTGMDAITNFGIPRIEMWQGVTKHTCVPSPQEAETGEHLCVCLYREFQTSQGYMITPCLNKTKAEL